METAILTVEERRDHLIRGVVLPGLERRFDHWAFEDAELSDRFDGRGINFLLDGLGPGWRIRNKDGFREGETVIVREIPIDRAKEQIQQRFQPSRTAGPTG